MCFPNIMNTIKERTASMQAQRVSVTLTIDLNHDGVRTLTTILDAHIHTSKKWE